MEWQSYSAGARARLHDAKQWRELLKKTIWNLWQLQLNLKMNNHDINLLKLRCLLKGEMKSDYDCQPVCTFLCISPKNNSINFPSGEGRLARKQSKRNKKLTNDSTTYCTRGVIA